MISAWNLRGLKKKARSLGYSFDSDNRVYDGEFIVGAILKVTDSCYSLVFERDGHHREEKDIDRITIDSLLQSGISVKIEGQMRDLVYGTGDEFFLNWLGLNGATVIKQIPGLNMSYLNRYQLLKNIEEKGGRIVRNEDVWKEFEERMRFIQKCQA